MSGRPKPTQYVLVRVGAFTTMLGPYSEARATEVNQQAWWATGSMVSSSVDVRTIDVATACKLTDDVTLEIAEAARELELKLRRLAVAQQETAHREPR